MGQEDQLQVDLGDQLPVDLGDQPLADQEGQYPVVREGQYPGAQDQVMVDRPDRLLMMVSTHPLPGNYQLVGISKFLLKLLLKFLLLMHSLLLRGLLLCLKTKFYRETSSLLLVSLKCN